LFFLFIKLEKMKIKICKATRSLPLPLFISEVAAGFPSPADGYMDHALNLNQLLISHPAATFFVRVSGESMIGANIHSGDVLVVDRSLEPKHRDIVIAVLNGEFTVKRVLRKGGKIFLAPENRAFPSIEIGQEEDFQVWGVVTYVIHKAK
jgi:DNA polymerase V